MSHRTVYVGGTPRKNWGFSQWNFIYTKGLLMHPTTNTYISDTITKLRKLDSKLDQASFMPLQEMLGLLVAGSIVLNDLSDSTVKSQFTEDEVAFIDLLVTRINTELEGIYADNEAENWDSSLDDTIDEIDREGWDHPEWDNWKNIYFSTWDSYTRQDYYGTILVL